MNPSSSFSASSIADNAPVWRRVVSQRLGFTLVLGVGLSLSVLLFSAPVAAQESPATAAEEQDPPSVWPDATPERKPQKSGPADGVWLSDEEGRKYFIDKVPKMEGWYTWIDEEEKIVRVRALMPLKVEWEDDQFFYFKVFDFGDQVAPPSGPTPEELEAMEATYRSDLADSDELRFVAFDRGLPNEGQWRNGFDLADMNGDGHLDIVSGPARKGGGTPLVFLGDSAGSWRLWPESRYPAAGYDYGDAAVADFNGDGHPDLALAIHLQGLVVLVGDGKGRFELWNRGIGRMIGPNIVSDGLIFSSKTLETVDWNQDGRPDLLAFAEGPTNIQAAAEGGQGRRGKAIYLNQGDGSWKSQVGSEEDNLIGDVLVLGDFNEDGRKDFVSSSRVLGSRRLLNLGVEDGDWRVLNLPGARPRGYVWGVAAADFDNDGHQDLAISYRTRELDVIREGIDIHYYRSGETSPDSDNAGSADAASAGPVVGTWERRPLTSTVDPKTHHSSLGAGDLNGDGVVDLVALKGNGGTSVFLGEKDGFFRREKVPELAPPPSHQECLGYQVQLKDLDGDGRDEVLAMFAGETGVEQQFGFRNCASGGAIRVWQAHPFRTKEALNEGSGKNFAPALDTGVNL